LRTKVENDNHGKILHQDKDYEALTIANKFEAAIIPISLYRDLH
jgi:hypothetical protein